ncbi:MAG TPA: M23 family metallopeptidase [Ottowia sp.]|nr:M23 family metallopeptidase [Ottowia sp.]HRL67896.1 M23 family metallopeptidase [Ottowia sp.]
MASCKTTCRRATSTSNPCPSSRPQGGYGNLVEVAHPHGYNTLYAHLSRVEVTKGQQLAAGDTVGLLGSTGRSTGPHLLRSAAARRTARPGAFSGVGRHRRLGLTLTSETAPCSAPAKTRPRSAPSTARRPSRSTP